MNNHSLPADYFTINRRKFIMNTVKSASGLALLPLAPSLANSDILFKKEYTVQDVINIILKEGKLDTIKDTLDTIKSGNADQKVTGIVTTMFPTITVIEEALKLNANFIIAHEPTFYNHRDDKEWIKNNEVVKQKQQLLEKHKMVIWRCHDYCHSLKPDAITYGFIRKAQWLPYYKTGENVLTIPEVSLQKLIQHLKSSLGIAHVRMIGDLNQKCTRIALLPGAWGGQKQVSTIEDERPDVLIVGEISEWETAEYIRDGQLMGRKTSLIILGHSVSEEPGMEWFADWLKPKVPDLKIDHIESKDPFIWL